MDQFEAFETKRFVQRLLGKGDVTGLMDKIQDIIPEDKQPELLDTISKVRAATSLSQETVGCADSPGLGVWLVRSGPSRGSAMSAWTTLLHECLGTSTPVRNVEAARKSTGLTSVTEAISTHLCVTS